MPATVIRMSSGIGLMMALLGLLGYQIAASENPAFLSGTRTPLASRTPTPTPIASRVADGAGPILVAPPDGSVLDDPIPDFRFIGLRQSFTHEIRMQNARGDVIIWTPGESETPLPAGRYTWQVCAIGYVDPTPKCSKMTWAFLIGMGADAPIQPPLKTLTPTPTITPMSTSDLIPVPPALIAPADGAILHTGIPDFRYEIIPNAQAYDIWIYGEGDFEALWVVTSFDVTGMYAGTAYTPTPTALPDGEYTWQVCARRYSSGRGICSTEMWRFTIVSP